MLSPAALAVITTSFHGADRSRALGVWAGIGGAGAAAGVLLSGLLTAGPGWQWVFWVNVLVLTAAGAAVLTQAPGVDGVLVGVLPGFLLAALGIGPVFVAATTTTLANVPPAEEREGSARAGSALSRRPSTGAMSLRPVEA